MEHDLSVAFQRSALQSHPMSCPRSTVLEALEKLAPLHLAEAWDNVGLLVDPEESNAFQRAFICIDLTETTLDEALEADADLVVAYHPVIFSGLKRLRLSAPSERIVVRALRAGLTIYSPHTALDAVPGGMADWLARVLGEASIAPITPHPSDPHAGSGRLVELHDSLSLDEAIERTKKYLKLPNLRVSRAETSAAIQKVAVCPGAGGSLFEQVGDVDLLITGEMRHHDLLARRARGTHVMVTDHTNCERGYLPDFAEKLAQLCVGLQVQLSVLDADPLQVV